MAELDDLVKRTRLDGQVKDPLGSRGGQAIEMRDALCS